MHQLKIWAALLGTTMGLSLSAVPTSLYAEAPSGAATTESQDEGPRMVPAYDNGVMVGVKTLRIRSGSELDTLGLKNGDVLTEINGVALTTPEAVASLKQAMTSGEAMTIQLLRDGAPLSLTVDIK